jgi:hypothetical protein
MILAAKPQEECPAVMILEIYISFLSSCRYTPRFSVLFLNCVHGLYSWFSAKFLTVSLF